MENLFQLAASVGGIGGLLAVVVIFMYRHDRNGSECRLTKIIAADQATREKHTMVLTELIIWLKMRNGKGG